MNNVENILMVYVMSLLKIIVLIRIVKLNISYIRHIKSSSL